MSRTSGGGSRQAELFPRSKRPAIRLEENHRLVVLTEETDWTELERRVEQIRRSKLKSAAGRPPHLRALIGALVLKATRDERKKALDEMMGLVGAVQKHLDPALQKVAAGPSRLKKDGKVAQAKAVQLHQTMKKLLPQIASWHRTGKVAANKILSLHLPQLYSIVRGKVGKAVEFGVTWGMTRLRGGFLLARVAHTSCELADTKFAVRAVEDCIALFGKAPRAYTYDRAGHSESNVATIVPGHAPPG